MCTANDELNCGGENEPCCSRSDYNGDYVPGCFSEDLLCIDDTCSPRADLPCGSKGKQCCDIVDYPDLYYYDGLTFCFSPAVCVDDECITCNSEGDTCCPPDSDSEDATCEGDLNCVLGTCEACGGFGESCCERVDYNGRESTYCEPGVECIEGVCLYCGFEGVECCGSKNGGGFCR